MCFLFGWFGLQEIGWFSEIFCGRTVCLQEWLYFAFVTEDKIKYTMIKFAVHRDFIIGFGFTLKTNKQKKNL